MIPGNTEGSGGYKWMFAETEGRGERRQPDAQRPGVDRRAGVLLPFCHTPWSKLLSVLNECPLSVYGEELFLHRTFTSKTLKKQESINLK